MVSCLLCVDRPYVLFAYYWLADCIYTFLGTVDGDLNNLIKKANYNQDNARILIKEFRGIGDLAVDLFFDNVQCVWPCIAPFIDRRSLRTAEELGIGTDLDVIYDTLGRNPMEMSELANGLSRVRLEHMTGEVEEELEEED